MMLMPRLCQSLELTECVDQFYTSHASSSCQLLDIKLAEQKARCTLVAECETRAPAGNIEQVQILTLSPADMAILTNKQGALVVSTRE